MSTKLFGPRKQRTRAHVIADLSVHHVEGFILEEGHTAQRLGSDYGYDLVLFTHDARGYIEPDAVYFQLKATETLRTIGRACVFDLDIRDYNLWIVDKLPVILALFDASRRRAYWVHIQAYFDEDAGRRPKKGAKHVRLRVPMRQVMSRQAIARIREIKTATCGLPTGDEP